MSTIPLQAAREPARSLRLSVVDGMAHAVVRKAPWPRLFVRLTSVRPSAGAAHRPLVPSGAREEPARADGDG